MLYTKAFLADLLNPVTAFLNLGSSARRGFLLESVEGGENIGRYSFLGVDPYQVFEGQFEGFRRRFPSLREPADPDLPPFTGGAIGIFAYEMVRELERLPDLIRPDGHLDPATTVLMDFYATVVAFDHVKHQIIIMSHESRDRVREMERRLRSVPPAPALIDPGQALPSLGCVGSSFREEDFCAAVETSKEYIRAGDIFQVVLSQRFEADYPGDPFNVYRALRYVNPSPYLFYLRMGDLHLAGSSPEMLVRVQGRDLEYRPIAGTRRRGRNPEEEKHFEEELLSDEKERAEHLMLVDLGRNDLGRVSTYGSVHVADLMFLEKYSHVMHITSSLRGRLRPGLDRFDALAACFPAGTVTGAPKVRAMEIIEELEPCRRGVYAGAVGYLDFSGNLDSCIGIRTIAIKNGKAYLQAGAGIVADSVPELEHKECRNKARALFRALELASALEPRTAARSTGVQS